MWQVSFSEKKVLKSWRWKKGEADRTKNGKNRAKKLWCLWSLRKTDKEIGGDDWYLLVKGTHNISYDHPINVCMHIGMYRALSSAPMQPIIRVLNARRAIKKSSTELWIILFFSSGNIFLKMKEICKLYRKFVKNL